MKRLSKPVAVRRVVPWPVTVALVGAIILYARSSALDLPRSSVAGDSPSITQRIGSIWNASGCASAVATLPTLFATSPGRSSLRSCRSQ
jgi:hypothetical protein